MTQIGDHAPDSGRGTSTTSADTWTYVAQHLLVVLIFIVAIFNAGAQTPAWPAVWNALFIGAGMLCLGFGAGMLFYQRRQRSTSAALRAEFSELSTRARGLGAEMDEFITRKQDSTL